LELQKVLPEGSEQEDRALNNIPSESVSQVFNVTIYGGTNAVAAGNSVHQRAVQAVTHLDIDSLVAYFRNNDVEEDDLADLVEAIEADEARESSVEEMDTPGPRTRSWMSKMFGKAMSGAWKVTTDVAGKVLSEGISSYYDFGGADLPPPDTMLV
jgi:hypothetical protein